MKARSGTDRGCDAMRFKRLVDDGANGSDGRSRQTFCKFAFDPVFARNGGEPLDLWRAREGDELDLARRHRPDRIGDAGQLRLRGVAIGSDREDLRATYTKRRDERQSAVAGIELHADAPTAQIFIRQGVEHAFRCRFQR